MQPFNLNQVRNDIKTGKYQDAFETLINASHQNDDFTLQVKYASLFETMVDHLPNLKEIRIAILPSSTTNHFCHILKFWLAQQGLKAIILETEYSTIHQTILNPQSDLYEFNPDITFIFTNYRDVRFPQLNDTSSKEAHKAVARAVDHFKTLWDTLRQHSNSFIIQNNADIPFQRIFGNYEGVVLWGQQNMLRSFNLELAAAVPSGVTIFDLDYLSGVYGKQKWHEPRFWYHSKHAFALDATGLVAFEAAKLIGAITGRSKKCLVLDLDNTLWGGVIGDDGVKNIKLGVGPDGEAFVDFQKYILELKNRGIILAVCSKNTEDLAKEPFLHHPDMQIKLQDIAIFKANWNDKVANIKEIAHELNIGLDSLVFIDDNPVERELVKNMLPMVSVPCLPKDPAHYIETLSAQSYFETISFSDEDKKRNDLYRSNTERLGFQKEFTDLSDYLKSLDMNMTVSEITDFNLSRATQLINKSNQFHLTTTRYNEHEVLSFQQQENKLLRCFNLTDRFGDNGLISVVILKKNDDNTLLIDTWVMSCRVLARTAEEFIMKEIVEIGQQLGCVHIKGQYRPTPKNQLVKDLYNRLNFTLEHTNDTYSSWTLPLENNKPSLKTFIKKTKD